MSLIRSKNCNVNRFLTQNGRNVSKTRKNTVNKP